MLLLCQEPEKLSDGQASFYRPNLVLQRLTNSSLLLCQTPDRASAATANKA